MNQLNTESIPFYQFPVPLLTMDLTWSDKIVYMLLYDRIRLSMHTKWKWAGKYCCFFSQQDLSDRTGLSDRTIRESVTRLRKAGLIEIRRAKGAGNMYFLTDELLSRTGGEFPVPAEENCRLPRQKTSGDSGGKLPLIHNTIHKNSHKASSPASDMPGEMICNGQRLVWSETAGAWRWEDIDD